MTLLHQDINYQLGRIATQSAYYQLPLAREGRLYASVNHTYSVNRGCETQLLAPCFGSPTDWTPADHEQRWGATAGIIQNDAHGGWLSGDLEYGSGLSSASCPSGTPGFCKRTPHITVDAERAWRFSPSATALLRVRNLLNDRYFVTLQNAQGNHYAAPRTIEFGLNFTTGK
ncbi:MAG: TonB-dependent receptor [Candidatus Eremiobacteraeota bacterium]|nr:TonB-dependent receptor [Candidatus Eremiobacteraeota bacterium]